MGKMSAILEIMISDLTILSVQTVAAALMAADYALTKQQRHWINQVIRRKAIHVNRKSDQVVRSITEGKSVQLITAITSLVLAVSIFSYSIRTFGESVWMFFITLVTGGLFLYGFNFFLPLVLEGLVYLLPAVALRAVANFIIKCPKGSVFGLGFIFLVLSFVYRWSNMVGAA